MPFEEGLGDDDMGYPILPQTENGGRAMERSRMAEVQVRIDFFDSPRMRGLNDRFLR
jgi:hypothetical protein